MKLSVYASLAQTDRKAWKSYVNGHAQVLKDFGIEVLDSYGDEWIHNPKVYLINAIDENGVTVGGIKLHLTNSDYKLPVEYAIGDLAPEISSIISQHEGEGAGEICGLWIAKEAGRRGLAHFLSRVAIAICKPLSVKYIYGISSPFTINMFMNLGYERITQLGLNGDFFYPTEEFLSTAVVINDTFLLSSADEHHRERIQSLRDFPIQTFKEVHLGVETEIFYNLTGVLP